MQTTQMIRNSAEVLTIVSLAPGDVYKRVEETSYDGAKIRFGVVQSVMNNGTDAAVTAIELTPALPASVVAAQKVFTGSKPEAIFPATPDEVTAHLEALLDAAQKAVARATEEQEKAQRQYALVQSVRASVGTLNAPQAVDALPAAEITENP